MHSPRSSSPRAGPPSLQRGMTAGAKGVAFRDELRRRKQAQGQGVNIQWENEHVLMEEEDIASKKIEKQLRDLAIRVSVEAEIQARKRREEAERSEKLRLAEIRRSAVLERLRKAEEEQARIAREAAEAEARVLQAEERAKQKESNRILDDRVTMESEDERSSLIEHLWKEELERLQYNKDQEMKIALWEEQKRQADLEENANRALREAELLEKKRKLALLREKFPDMNTPAQPKASEDTRLQRIRHKAVYKSKVMKSGSEAPLESQMVIEEQQTEVAPEFKDDEFNEFLHKIQNMTAENDLRAMQNEISAKKRSLRIEQRQMSSSEEVADIRVRIIRLGRQEEALQTRLDGILGVGVSLQEATIDNPNKESIDLTSVIASAVVTNVATQMSISPPALQPSAQGRSMVQIYKRAEQVIRDGTALSTQIQEGKASANAADFPLLEIMELISVVNASNDLLAPGYSARLTECSQLLKNSKNVTPIVAATSVPVQEPIERSDSPNANQQHDVSCALVEPLQTQPVLNSVVSNVLISDELGPKSDLEVKNEDFDSTVEEDLDLDSMEGWLECVNTSMATAAHHAAYYGHSAVLEIILKYFDCNVSDETGKSPLHYAALSNQLECVVLLVQYNAAMVDMGDELGDTSLHLAAASAEGSSVLEFLLHCECSPNIANYEGKTIAHVARTLRNLEIVAAAGGMLYCVDMHSRTPLYCAASDGNNECIAYLMQQTPPEYQMWPDDKEGNSPLHIAAIKNNVVAVDMILSSLANIEDMAVVNKKHYTAAHVAASAAVLTKLFEHGADLWIPDAKNRFPLYIQAFYGRADSVAFLLSAAMNKKNMNELIRMKDLNGDSVLHVASLCGHIKCVTLLLYFLANDPNSAGLKPDVLAQRAGHVRIQQIILHVETLKAQGTDIMNIFGSAFEQISSCVVHYGSRWTKCYSAEYNSTYFYDRATGATTWELPSLYDVDPTEEAKTDAARDILVKFYSMYNTDKLYDVDKIVEAYKGKYTELFVDLANRYNVKDLTLFEGVYVE